MSNYIDAALDAMQKMAKELGVTGVAVFLDARNTDLNNLQPHVRIIGRMERPAQPETRGKDDAGTNYFGVVFTKLAEMLSTKRNSGNAGRPPRSGEYGWRGGLVFADDAGFIFVGFSGGSAEQDVLIAGAGAMALGYDPEHSEK